MQSDGDCVHRYEADLEPSTTNIIRLFFKTTNVKENMLLFLLRNPYAVSCCHLMLVIHVNHLNKQLYTLFVSCNSVAFAF